MSLNSVEGKVAIVTGSARGIGRATAKELARAGALVLGCHVSAKSEKLQKGLRAEIAGFGGKFIYTHADVTSPEDRTALLRTAINASSSGKINILVHNAAGGFEADKPYGWADIVNNQAQVAMLDEYMPSIDQGGQVVFVTSHWAHQYGEVRMLPHYGEVARTKRAAELAMRSRIDILRDRGIRLNIVTASLTKETGAHSVFEHASPTYLAKLEEKLGGFPHASHVGTGITFFVRSSNHESGDVFYIGNTKIEPIPPGHVGVQRLNRQEIENALPMYDNSIANRVYVDDFESTPDRKAGTGWYTIRRRDCIGHFKRSYGGMVFPAHLRMEAAAQTLGLVLKSLEPDAEGLAMLESATGQFTGRRGGFIFPERGEDIDMGDRMIMKAEILGIHPASDVMGKVQMYVGDRLVTEFPEITLRMVPAQEKAVELIEMSRRMAEKARPYWTKEAMASNSM